MVEQPISYIGFKIALGYVLLAVLSLLVTPVIGIVGVLAWMGASTLRIEREIKQQGTDRPVLGALDLGGMLPIVAGLTAAMAAIILGAIGLVGYLAYDFLMWLS